MELAADGGSDRPEREPDQPRHLRPAGPHSVGGGQGSGDASKVVEALRSSAAEELTIAERLASKARQAFALSYTQKLWMRVKR